MDGYREVNKINWIQHLYNMSLLNSLLSDVYVLRNWHKPFGVELRIPLITHCTFFIFYSLRLTFVSVISSYPPCRDGNVRFTKVPLKPWSDQTCER